MIRCSVWWLWSVWVWFSQLITPLDHNHTILLLVQYSRSTTTSILSIILGVCCQPDRQGGIKMRKQIQKEEHPNNEPTSRSRWKNELDSFHGICHLSRSSERNNNTFSPEWKKGWTRGSIVRDTHEGSHLPTRGMCTCVRLNYCRMGARDPGTNLTLSHVSLTYFLAPRWRTW